MSEIEPQFSPEEFETEFNRPDKLHIPHRCLKCPAVRALVNYNDQVQRQKFIVERQGQALISGIPDIIKQQIREEIRYSGSDEDPDARIAKIESINRQNAAFHLSNIDCELDNIKAAAADMTDNCEGPLELSAAKNGVDHIVTICASSGFIPFPDAADVARVITLHTADAADSAD